MPLPPPGIPKPLRKRDIAALFLAAAGIVGMIAHFARETPAEPTPAAPAGAARKQYSPPAPSRLTHARAHPEEDPARDTRRLLRDFIIPYPGVKNLPASDALAVLRHHWDSLPHAGDTTPPPPFSDRLPPEYASLPVSLEIPGVSLLTNLRLLAAQTGLKLTLTHSGAVLLPEGPTEHRAPSRGEWPLSSGTLSTYSGAASRLRSRHDPEQYGPVLTHSWILSPVFATRKLSESASSVNIAPEVIEFEGFTDYYPDDPAGETPEEAVPAEPLDSSEEKPVKVKVNLLPEDGKSYFLRDNGAELETLLSGMGISARPEQLHAPETSTPSADSPEVAEDSGETDGAPSSTGWAWSLKDGMLSAAGDARVTRVAAEVATAIQEAAELGARIEIVAVEWPSNTNPPPRPPDHLTYTTNPPSTRVGSGLVRCGAYDSVTFPAPPSRAYDLAIPLRDRLTLEIDATGSCFQINSGVSVGERASYAPEDLGKGNVGVNIARKLDPVTVSPGVWTRLDIPSDRFNWSGREPPEDTLPPLERSPLEQGFFLRVSRAVVSGE